MKRRTLWAIVVAVIVIAVVCVLRVRTSSDVTASRAGAASPSSTGAPARSPSATAAPRPPDHVTRLATPAERQAIADRIATARAARARQSAPEPPRLPGPTDIDTHDLERAPMRLKQALDEAIPFLAECYKTGSFKQRRSAVLMTLVGDPDVGTLIDTEQLHDPDGKPLEPDLESCLRTTLGSLELPPIDSVDPLHLQYSFVFDD